MIGLIGGYGLEGLIERPKKENHDAIFGKEKGTFQTIEGNVAGKNAIMIPRHGINHDTPPHMIPYMSMIRLLKHRDVDGLITVNSVGIMKPDITKGSFILLKDFVNFGKEVTFFDDFKDGAHHTNLSEPYSARMNSVLSKSLSKKKLKFYPDKIYVNSHGPRLETPSEIRNKFKPCGDVVGMTGAYEAILANELGIPIATICMGANYAEGCGERANFDEMKKTISKMQQNLFSVLRDAFPEL